MWLEETAAIWIPLLCVIVAGAVWRLISLSREVRALQRRIDSIEGAERSSEGEEIVRRRTA